MVQFNNYSFKGYVFKWDKSIIDLMKYNIHYLNVEGTEMYLRAPWADKFFMVEGHSLVAILLIVRDAESYGYEFLTDLYATDLFQGEKGRFLVAYRIFNSIAETSVILFALVDEGSAIATIQDVYTGSSWSEREAWEMVGVYFAGHRCLQRLLTDYSLKGHPIRRDFPFVGYNECFYSYNTKAIEFVDVEFMQEYRIFDFYQNWGISAGNVEEIALDKDYRPFELLDSSAVDKLEDLLSSDDSSTSDDSSDSESELGEGDTEGIIANSSAALDSESDSSSISDIASSTDGSENSEITAESSEHSTAEFSSGSSSSDGVYLSKDVLDGVKGGSGYYSGASSDGEYESDGTTRLLVGLTSEFESDDDRLYNPSRGIKRYKPPRDETDELLRSFRESQPDAITSDEKGTPQSFTPLDDPLDSELEAGDDGSTEGGNVPRGTYRGRINGHKIGSDRPRKVNVQIYWVVRGNESGEVGEFGDYGSTAAKGYIIKGDSFPALVAEDTGKKKKLKKRGRRFSEKQLWSWEDRRDDFKVDENRKNDLSPHGGTVGFYNPHGIGDPTGSKGTYYKNGPAPEVDAFVPCTVEDIKRWYQYKPADVRSKMIDVWARHLPMEKVSPEFAAWVKVQSFEAQVYFSLLLETRAVIIARRKEDDKPDSPEVCDARKVYEEWLKIKDRF